MSFLVHVIVQPVLFSLYNVQVYIIMYPVVCGLWGIVWLGKGPE